MAVAPRLVRTFAAEIVLVPLYVVLRVLEFTNVPGPATDTPTYEAVARMHLWGWRFYAAERGLTIPLFYKLVPGAEARIVAQLALSILAWSALAAAVAASIRTRPLRVAAFAAVLGVSLTWEVVRWDATLLSESLTLSLNALLLAAGLVLARRPTRGRAAVFGVVAFFWVFARDTNAYVLLVLGVLVALTLLRPGSRRIKAGVAVTCVALFAACYASADTGKRWLQPMRDVVAHRVLPDTQMRSYFVARGLDPGSDWPRSAWMVEDSRSTYLHWLLSHPKYALVRPVHGYENTLWSSPYNLDALVDPNLEIYDSGASHRVLAPPRVVEAAFFPHGLRVVGLLLLCSLLVAAGAAALGSPPTRAALVPAAVLLTTYPHFLVVWLQSGLEVDRHAVEAALLLRLGILLLAVYALEGLLGAPILRRRRSTSARLTRSVEAPGS